MEDMDIARRIASARIEAGLSQEDLGAAVGKSGQAIGHYEAGRSQPKPQVLQAIAAATGKPVGWFFDESEPEPIQATATRLIDLLSRQAAGEPVELAGTLLGDTEAFREFAADRRLLSVHAVTPEDLEALRQTRIVGRVPRDKEGVVKYLFLWREWGPGGEQQNGSG